MSIGDAVVTAIVFGYVFYDLIEGLAEESWWQRILDVMYIVLLVSAASRVLPILLKAPMQ